MSTNEEYELLVNKGYLNELKEIGNEKVKRLCNRKIKWNMLWYDHWIHVNEINEDYQWFVIWKRCYSSQNTSLTGTTAMPTAVDVSNQITQFWFWVWVNQRAACWVIALRILRDNCDGSLEKRILKKNLLVHVVWTIFIFQLFEENKTFGVHLPKQLLGDLALQEFRCFLSF